jgi:Rrf2 family iron-sulfur cluster assembly transcriptional regulator
MRITTRGRYALRATLTLAKLGKNGIPVSINTLSESENISPIFLEQIFFKLRKAEIVSSIRGPGGGFYFSRPLEDITVKAILDAAGEDQDLTLCDKHADNCDRIDSCISHKVWVDLTNLVNNYLSSLTLASIIAKNEPAEENEAS